MIIAFCGRLYDYQTGVNLGVKGVGKDSAASCLEKVIQSQGPRRIVRMAFADALKNLVCDHYSLNREEWDHPSKKEQIIPGLGKTFRQLCEILGTNARNIFPGVWVSKVTQRIIDHCREYDPPIQLATATLGTGYSVGYINRLLRDLPEPLPPVFLVTDMRMPDEYRELKRLGAFIVQVARPIHAEVLNVDLHESNRVYEEMEPDFFIENDGDLEQLEQKMKLVWSRLSTSE